jgi:hypothetical protein
MSPCFRWLGHAAGRGWSPGWVGGDRVKRMVLKTPYLPPISLITHELLCLLSPSHSGLRWGVLRTLF